LTDKIVTLTLTLSREDTQALYDNSAANAEEWEATEGERIPWLDNVVTALKAALDADPPADSLERAIAECEAKGWCWDIEDGWVEKHHFFSANVYRTESDQFNAMGKTPLAALRSAMAAAEQEGAK
jgi:hypothetical protein